MKSMAIHVNWYKLQDSMNIDTSNSHCDPWREAVITWKCHSLTLVSNKHQQPTQLILKHRPRSPSWLRVIGTFHFANYDGTAKQEWDMLLHTLYTQQHLQVPLLLLWHLKTLFLGWVYVFITVFMHIITFLLQHICSRQPGTRKIVTHTW